VPHDDTARLRHSRQRRALLRLCVYRASATALVAEATQRLDEEWDDLIVSARDMVARVVAPVDDDSFRDGYDPQGHFNLFNNTTSALARVLSRIDLAFGRRLQLYSQRISSLRAVLLQSTTGGADQSRSFRSLQPSPAILTTRMHSFTAG
jgi:hypothetical protein